MPVEVNIMINQTGNHRITIRKGENRRGWGWKGMKNGGWSRIDWWKRGRERTKGTDEEIRLEAVSTGSAENERTGRQT